MKKMFFFSLLLVFCFQLFISCDDPTTGGELDTPKQGQIEVTLNGEIVSDGKSAYEFSDIWIESGDEDEYKTLEFEIKNIGKETLKLTGSPLVKVELATANFSVEKQPTKSSLEPNEKTKFTIKFKPTSTNQVVGEFIILNDGIENKDFLFKVYGTGKKLVPIISVTDEKNNVINLGATYTFESIKITEKTSVFLKLKNSGKLPLNLTGEPRASISGSGSKSFSIVTEPSQTISVGETSVFEVQFAPDSAGEKSAILSIVSNDVNTPNYSIVLKGAGIDSYPTLGLLYNDEPVKATTGTIDLDNDHSEMYVGENYDFTVKLKNYGETNLNFNTSDCITISGSGSESFSVKQLPPETIAPDNESSLILTFNPKAEQKISATITIRSNSKTNSDYSFLVQGTAVERIANIKLSYKDNEIEPTKGIINLDTDYEKIIVGETYLTTINILNDGNKNLVFNLDDCVVFTGEGSDCFSLRQKPSDNIASDNTSSLIIAFTPKSEQIYSATVCVKSNSKSNGEYYFSIKASAVERKANINLIYNDKELAATTGTIDLDSDNSKMYVGDEYDFSIKIKNDGDKNLLLDASKCITITGAGKDAFSVKQSPAETIAPNKESTLILTFSPKSAQKSSATIMIRSNSSVNSEYSFIVQGTAVERKASLKLTSNDEEIEPTKGIINFDLDNKRMVVGKPYYTTINILSTGDKSLTFDLEKCIEITGAGSECFKVHQLPAETVAPGNSTSMVISFIPEAAQFYNATFCLKSNSDTNGEYSFALQGTGIIGSSDATLSNLISAKGNISPDFLPSKKNYTLTIDSTEKQIEFTPTCSNSNYTSLKVENKPVSSDSNVTVDVENGKDITFEVVAENGESTETYIVTIQCVDGYSNTKLKTLYFTEGKEDAFPYNCTSGSEYYLTPDVVSIKIKAITENPAATISIDEVDIPQDEWTYWGLTGDNTFNVKVTAQDGITTEIHPFTCIWYGYKWKKVGTLKYPTYNHTVVVHNNNFHLAEGSIFFNEEEQTIFWVSPDAQDWTSPYSVGLDNLDDVTEENKDDGLSHFAGATVLYDNKIFTIGGATNKVSISSNGMYYRHHLMRLSDGTEFPQTEEHSAVVFDDKIFLFGGNDLNGKQTNSSYYSTDGINWIENPTPSWAERAGQAAAVYDGKIYLTGGILKEEGFDDGGFEYGDVWSSSDGVTWTQETLSEHSWTARNDHTLTATKIGMFLIGGNDGNWLNDVWFSKNGKDWICVTKNADFEPRAAHAAVVKDGFLYVICGTAIWDPETSEEYYGYVRNDIWCTYVGE